ncbi:MAG: hypothetical protein IKO57_07085 [Treponema sp.]|nr:hypothetical protein [Treponema sp.]
MHIVFFGSGGSALVARFLGEKNQKRANEVFSFLIYATIVAGILLSIAGWFAISCNIFNTRLSSDGFK